MKNLLTICLLIYFAPLAEGQISHDNSAASFGYELIESEPNAKDDFLVNTRLFEFDSSLLEPWIEGITHLRAFGVDFQKGKGSDGLYQYVDNARLTDFVSFCKAKNLKVVWTLNMSSFTLEQEMSYLRDLISRGLNIVAFEYGGEFYLKKYAFGDLSAKGVVETIRMDGENRDYLNLLDMWLPEMTKEYPLDEYEHILITASESPAKNKKMNYRREFNQKVFDYVANNQELEGNVSYSYHIYAGARPEFYNNDEEDVLTPDQVDWSFLNKKPPGGRWVVTESGYYVKDYSPEQLRQAKKFYVKQSQVLGDQNLLGVHTLLIQTNKLNPLAMYNLNGLTPVGEMIQDYLDNRNELDSGESEGGNTESEPNPETGSGENTDDSNSPGEKTVLVSISPKYNGGFAWIHFSHKLTFSNGKSYNRSYWFSSPDFSEDDLGKPIGYFKKVVKSK